MPAIVPLLVVSNDFKSDTNPVNRAIMPALASAYQSSLNTLPAAIIFVKTTNTAIKTVDTNALFIFVNIKLLLFG